MTRTDIIELSRAPVKVLFLRSYAKAPFAVAMAGGFINSQELEVWQYPPWPPEGRSKLDKLPHAQMAWEDLQVRLLQDSKELLEKIHSGFFDLAVLSDEDGQLFGFQDFSIISKCKKYLGWLYNVLTFNMFPGKARGPCLKSLGISLSDVVSIMPVAVIDRSDAPFLTPASQQFLQLCSTYFKRELPFDRFFLFYHQRPTPWKKRRKELMPVVEKVYGIPLGIEDLAYAALKKQRTDNQPVDVLFVGNLTNTMRQTGVDHLRKWARERSYKVEIHESLPYEEYCSITAKSKVTISIAGGGWDCFRHYEAIALGSIPLMNKPTVDAVWWHVLPSDVFFENTFCDFGNQLDKLLLNDDLRRKCLSELKKYEEQHFLHSKIAEFVVRTTLDHKFPGLRTVNKINL